MKFKKLYWIILPSVSVCLLISAIFTKVFNNSKIINIKISNSYYNNLNQLESFCDFFEKETGIDFNSLTISNNSSIKCDSYGNITNFDVSSIGKQENELYLINFQLSNNEYNCWIDKYNDDLIGKQCYLKDALFVSMNYFLNKNNYNSINIEFNNQTIMSLNNGKFLYQENKGIVNIKETIFGQYTPIEFYNENMKLNLEIYIERK